MPTRILALTPEELLAQMPRSTWPPTARTRVRQQRHADALTVASIVAAGQAVRIDLHDEPRPQQYLTSLHRQLKRSALLPPVTFVKRQRGALVAYAYAV